MKMNGKIEMDLTNVQIVNLEKLNAAPAPLYESKHIFAALVL